MAYLKRKGKEADVQTAVEKDGIIKAIYMKDENGGFSVHFFQR